MTQYSSSNPFDPNSVEFQERPPGWPKVIGIVSIVLASLGLFCGVCAVGGMAMLPMAGQQNPEFANLPPSVQITPGLLLHIGLGIIGSILLVVAGIQTIRRNALGRTLHILSAIFGIAILCFGIYRSWIMIPQMEQFIQDYPNSMFSKSNPKTDFVTQVVTSVLLGGAYHFFLLFWFLVVKRTPESMVKSTQTPAA